MGEEAGPLFDRAALRVRHGIIEAGDAGVRDRPGAHGARLQCYPEVAAGEAEVAQMGCRGADRDHFGMGGGIIVAPVAIFPFTDDAAVEGDDRADGHLSRSGGGISEIERTPHRIGQGEGRRHSFAPYRMTELWGRGC